MPNIPCLKNNYQPFLTAETDRKKMVQIHTVRDNSYTRFLHKISCLGDSKPPESTEGEFNDVQRATVYPNHTDLGDEVMTDAQNAAKLEVRSWERPSRRFNVETTQTSFSVLDTRIDSLSPESYTVGIVCALDKELLAVRALFDRRHRNLSMPLGDTNHYALGQVALHNVVAVCLPSGEYGTNSAASVVSHMVRTFPSLKFCLLVGIGGGVPSPNHDIRLGDVVVSWPSDGYSGVIQYDLGKSLKGNQFKVTGALNRPSRFLMTALSSLRSDPDISPGMQLLSYVRQIQDRRPEYKSPAPELDKLYQSDCVLDDSCGPCDCIEVSRNPRMEEYPRVHYGLIASGNRVIKDSFTRDSLMRQHNVLCVEMEAAGVMNAIDCLVIRGICDYADSHKTKIWQEYAAAAAAAYMKMFLSVVRQG